MDQILQHTVNAMVLGSTYALLGIGLTIIFGIMRVVNFAHGELYTLGAYVAYGMVAVLNLDFFSSILVAAFIGMLVGALIEFVFLRRIERFPF